MDTVVSTSAGSPVAAFDSGDKASPAHQQGVWRFSLTAGLLVFAFLAGFFHVFDVDVGYHIRTGTHILESHKIPSVNTFSYTTPNQEWLLQQWWPGILYSRIYHMFGVTGLITAKASIGALLTLLLWCSARRLCPQFFLPFWLATLGVVIARVRFFERPDLISALIFALVVYLDVRFEKNRRWQWLGLPLVMAFWANTHAGVIYGFVFLGATAAGEWVDVWRARGQPSGQTVAEGSTIPVVRLCGILFALLASVLAVQLINPNGYRVLLVPITQATSGFWQSIIGEYQSPSWKYFKLFYLSLGALAVMQALTWRQLRFRWLLVALAFAYLACSAQRSMLVCVIVAVPYAAFLASRLPSMRPIHRVQRLQPLLLPTAWATVVLLAFLPSQIFRFGIGFHPRYYPTEIYGFIQKEVPPQNIFNSMHYGGGMLWWLYPDFKPFIDGRGDAYTPEFWQKEYFPVLGAKPGWRDILKKHDVHAVWLQHEQLGQPGELAKLLFEDPEWAIVAFNDHSLLFLERNARNQATIASNEFRYVWSGDFAFSKVTPDTLSAASREARRALERSPDSTFARTAVARTAMLSGDYASAAMLYSVLLDTVSDAEIYSRDYGLCLLMLGRLQEADEVFQRMIGENWLPGYAYYMRHLVAAKTGNPLDARRYLDRAVEHEPANEKYRQAKARLDAPANPTTAQ